MAMLERQLNPRERNKASTLTSWDGEEIVEDHDPETGARMFVFIHSTALGPAAGGTRMRVYPSIEDAVIDGTRLAAGMTRKLAIPGVPFGGGKAVIAVPELPHGEVRRRLLLRYGDLLASLQGRFITGIDMNTTPEDMDVVGERAPNVFCRTEANGGSGDASPMTAAGVLHGIRAAVEHVYGSPSLAGRSVLVQGVGAVGRSLAEQLVSSRATVLVSDIDMPRATEVAGRLGARVVEPEAAVSAAVDVYAPCAIGGTLNERSIPELRARVVAGSANNQLWGPEDAARLEAAGIQYAPDYVINAGGALYALGLEVLGWSEAEIARRVAGIGETLSVLFRRAREEGITTAAAAERLAAESLERAVAARRA